MHKKEHIQLLLAAVTVRETSDLTPGGGGGGTPLYGLYRYVRRQRVWFFGCFGHK